MDRSLSDGKILICHFMHPFFNPCKQFLIQLQISFYCTIIPFIYRKMYSHLFYLIVSECIIYCLHQQKTYTTAIGKISNCLACRHKMERTVLFQLLSKLLKLSIYIYKNNIMWVSFLIFPGNLQICGSCRKTSLFPVNLYFVHLLFHIYRLLSALRRFDKSVCFSPHSQTPYVKTQNGCRIFAVRISASGNFSRQKCSISAIKICSTP